MKLDFDSLVPECYADFRSLVHEALQFFLQELPPERRAAIIAEQLQIHSETPLDERLVAFLKHCPTLHKVGQILARHPALDKALRIQLQRLESLPASLTVSDLEPLINAELGETAAQLELGAEPLAEGSVAVVVPFDLKAGHPGEMRRGVLKILKPGVAQRIAEELLIADRFGAWLETRSTALGLPKLGYRETITQVAGMLRAEISLDIERRNLATAANLYARNANVRVPELFPFHSAQITAMERIEGRKVTEATDMGPAERRKLAQRLVIALLAQPFFNDSDAALFHGDPHAGNLFLDESGKVVIIDWSLSGTMDRASRHAIIAILIGAITLNRTRIRDGLERLISGAFDERRLEQEIKDAMLSVPFSRLPGFDWLLSLLDRIAFSGAEFAPEFTVFRKSLFTLNGVFADISDDYSINLPIARTAVLQFYRELGPRLLNISGRKRFGIQLTNLELMTIGMMWPITVGRYWMAGLETVGRRIMPEKNRAA